jgi:hypothetical protein
MHKTQFMSHRISLPVSLVPLGWKRADVQPVSKREFFENPASTTLRYRFVEQEKKCDAFDPWQLRDEFLGWKIEDWQAFFYMAGGWSGGGYITQDDFTEWQRLLREALVRPARDWNALAAQFAPGKVSKLTGPLQMLFDWKSKVPVAKVILTDSLTAMIATIQVDALQGVEFRVCARPDCKNPPFRIEARQKIYCSADCAHLVAVRNSRKRAADRAERKGR